MKTYYYTRPQAEAICAAHQYLVGQPFTYGNEAAGVIAHITVAPYSRILQWKFVQLLLNGVPHAQALDISINGRYDVIAILTQKEDAARNEPGIISLRHCLAERDIPFDSKAYVKLQQKN